MNCFAMAALSDTPTPAQISMMPADELQVSIKVEQVEGVLHDENDEYGSDDNGSVNGRRVNHSIMQCDSHYPPEALNRGSSHMINIPRDVQIKSEPSIDIDDRNDNSNFPRDLQIKSEPPIDIDDRNGNVDSASALMTPLRPSSAHSPVIRLTPTNKLMPSVNASNPKRRYECPYTNCTKSYGKSSHLRSHLTWHTGIKPFVCQAPGCGKGFTRSDELNRHVRTHTGEKPFECVQCSKKFSRSDHLTKHLATHSKQMAGTIGGLTSPLQPTPKRQRMNKQSPRKLSPMVMMLGQTELDQPTTDFCKGIHFIAGFMAKTEPGLVPPPQLVPRPDIECLPQLEARAKIEPLQQLVPCPEIKPIRREQAFPSSSSENLTEPETTVKVKYETPDESDVSYMCHSTIAGLEMRKPKTEMYIKAEQQQPDDVDGDGEDEEDDEPDDDAIMPEANLPPIPLAIIPVANICPTTSSPISASLPLDRPKKVRKRKTPDNGVRPFPCFECSKQFKRQDDLNRHTRTHTGEKPFHCNECEKRFMRSDHLKKHMNTHTRIR